MEKEYIGILKNILSSEDFSRLTNEVFYAINDRQAKIDLVKATKLANVNMATILIIGIEISKDENVDIEKMIEWYNICPLSDLVANSYRDFIAKFKYYIKVIIKEVKKNFDNK